MHRASLLLGIALAVSGCSREPTSRSVDDFCDPDLVGERVAFTGYLSYKAFMFCGDDSWGDTQCPLTIESEPGGPSVGTNHIVWIYLGSEPNRMHMPTKTNFGLEDIVVFGNGGKRLDLHRPVRIVADIDRRGDDGYCTLEADTLTQARGPTPG